MCLYRKSLYVCNHSQICGEQPMTACQAQREYAAGAAAEPCDRVETHARNTIRVSRLCAACRDKKVTIDRQLDVVKSRMAELRRHLDESYDNCMKHLDEAGLDHEDEDEPGNTTAAAGRKSTGGKGKGKKATPEPAKEEDPPVDPVQEFLRKKMMETDSHLMMGLEIPEKEKEEEEEERFCTVRPHHHLLAARAVAMVVWKQPFCPGCGGKERKRSREGGSAV
ncbi:hypothetical protein F5X96DRAFT_694482 [Biscogniauxia mediterranea]|nr:hypothetical protein F5X96DRAFT_694482 [Biscogniauxia mediterranea]